MVKRTLIYALPIAALLLVHGTMIAEPTEAPTPTPPAAGETRDTGPATEGKGDKRRGKQKKKRHHHHHHRGRLSPEALEKLTPEERQRFLKNYERWEKLSPDRRSSLRKREMHRRQRIEKETRDALEKSNTPLSESQRNFFFKRYETERKQLETDLRKELEEKRQKGIEEISSRLLKEAAAQPVEGTEGTNGSERTEGTQPEEKPTPPPAPPVESEA